MRFSDNVLREAAREAGKLHFFTGRPCKAGHLSNRFVSSGACVACGALVQSNVRQRARDHKDEIVELKQVIEDMKSGEFARQLTVEKLKEDQRLIMLDKLLNSDSLERLVALLEQD